MRKLGNILIIIFVLLSFYILRDDLKVLYDRALSYFEKTPKIQISDVSTAINKLNNIPEKKVSEIKKIIETPGPLRAPSEVVIPGVNTTDLSKAGIIEETNRNRNEIGQLPPLSENQKLDMSAKKKVDDMFLKQYFEHISPSGVGVDGLVAEVGYEYILVGENLALGNFKNDRDLLNAWMNSPGHRANILNKHYTEIGVAVGRGSFEGKQVWLAVQHFGAPRSLCPTIDSILKGTVDLTQKNINLIQTDLTNRKEDINLGVVVGGEYYK